MLLAFALSIMAANRGRAVVDVHGRLLGGVLDGLLHDGPAVTARALMSWMFRCSGSVGYGEAARASRKKYCNWWL